LSRKDYGRQKPGIQITKTIKYKGTREEQTEESVLMPVCKCCLCIEAERKACATNPQRSQSTKKGLDLTGQNLNLTDTKSNANKRMSLSKRKKQGEDTERAKQSTKNNGRRGGRLRNRARKHRRDQENAENDKCVREGKAEQGTMK